MATWRELCLCEKMIMSNLKGEKIDKSEEPCGARKLECVKKKKRRGRNVKRICEASVKELRRAKVGII
jgi:hypothetical protein